jgi:hypothetical protein
VLSPVRCVAEGRELSETPQRPGRPIGGGRKTYTGPAAHYRRHGLKEVAAMSIERRLQQAEERARLIALDLPARWDVSKLTGAEVDTLCDLARRAGVPRSERVEDMTDAELLAIAGERHGVYVMGEEPPARQFDYERFKQLYAETRKPGPCPHCGKLPE